MEKMSLTIGQEAPDFTLKNQFGEDVTLSSFRGKKNVVIVFYPFAFSGICTGELCTLRDDLGAYQNEDTELLAISCDAMYSNKAFAEAEGYKFSLLADFWPHGAVSTSYGVFNTDRGLAIRGTFIVDKEGKLLWQVVNGPGDARVAEEYKAALATL